MKFRDRIKIEIDNFIICWTSDDEERNKMRKYLDIYMEECCEFEEDNEELKDGETEETLLK